MKNLVVTSLFFIFFGSCKSNNNSKIKFDLESIDVVGELSNDVLFPKLKIKLSSKNNIMKIMKKENSFSSYIYCPLTSKNFFPEDISNEYYKLYGIFPQELVEKYNVQDSLYYYSISISFVDKDYNNLNREIVTSIIRDRECIECKLVFGFFPKRIKRNSFSDSFCIPISKIKEEIGE